MTTAEYELIEHLAERLEEALSTMRVVASTMVEEDTDLYELQDALDSVTANEYIADILQDAKTCLNTTNLVRISCDRFLDK